MPVGMHLKNNPHLWSGIVLGPNTSPKKVIRDDKGNIIGTSGLIKYC